MIGTVRNMPHHFNPIDLPGSSVQKKMHFSVSDAKVESIKNDANPSPPDCFGSPAEWFAENMTKDRFAVDNAAYMIRDYQFEKAIATLDARRMQLNNYARDRCEELRSYAWFCLGQLDLAKAAAREAKERHSSWLYLDLLLDGSLDDVKVRPKT